MRGPIEPGERAPNLGISSPNRKFLEPDIFYKSFIFINIVEVFV